MYNQRRADIGAEHDRKRRDQIHMARRRERRSHQSRSGAALQHGRQAQASEEGHETVPDRGAEHAPQVAAERADDPTADHVKAPEQEGNAAH